MIRPALLSSLLALAACQTPTDGPAGSPSADTSAAGHGASDHGAMGHDMSAASSYSDVAFLDGMAEHHQMAVDMAEMAGERAGSDRVRTLARDIAASQRAEIDSMRAWRARWFPDAPAAGPLSADDVAAMGMAGMDMDALGAARGAAFDRLFQEQMIPHHAGAIPMAAEAELRSERPEIRALARQIIEAQAREIGQMQAALDAAPAATPTDSGAAR